MLAALKGECLIVQKKGRRLGGTGPSRLRTQAACTLPHVPPNHADELVVAVRHVLTRVYGKHIALANLINTKRQETRQAEYRQMKSRM